MKVAIIGEGFGARVMAPVYRELDFEILLASSRDPAAVRRACAEDVDLVSVHSPPFLHLDHVMGALDRGRAVLCDKPFGRDAGEARAMRDRAREAGLPNFLNFEFRRQPSRMKLKQLLDDGAIGTLQHISGMFIGNGLRPQKHRWLFDARQAGGWIGAYGSHAIDMFRWLFGCEVADCGGISRIETRVRIDREGREQPSTAEDAFSSWFVMENGATVSYDTAFSASIMLPPRMILMGSEGSLELLRDTTLILHRPGQPDETFDFAPPPGDSHAPAMLGWLAEVRDALRDGRPLTPSFDDGVAAAEVMDRLKANLIRAGRRAEN